jgi:hypothetical protein
MQEESWLTPHRSEGECGLRSNVLVVPSSYPINAVSDITRVHGIALLVLSFLNLIPTFLFCKNREGERRTVRGQFAGVRLDSESVDNNKHNTESKGTSGYIKVCKGLHCRNRMPVVIKACVCFINCPHWFVYLCSCVWCMVTDSFILSFFHQTVRITTVVFSRHCKQCSEGVLRDMVSSFGKERTNKTIVQKAYCSSTLPAQLHMFIPKKLTSAAPITTQTRDLKGRVYMSWFRLIISVFVQSLWLCGTVRQASRGKSTLQQE